MHLNPPIVPTSASATMTSATLLTPEGQAPRKVWLDCDPGHDDAIALLLALYLDQIQLVGISSVNGNAPLVYTHANAAQLLALYRAPKDLPLHRGLAKPLKKEYIHPPVSIHGHSGLDGVLHMPPLAHPSVRHWYDQFEPSTDSSPDSNKNEPRTKEGDGTAVPALIAYLENSVPKGEKITVVITGPCTNIAAVRHLRPHLFDTKVDKVVIMGGAFDIPQWTPFAEFNIAVDPDALDELLKSRSVGVVLVPLNVTHKAIFDRKTHARLLDPSVTDLKEGDELPKPISQLRESLSTMLTFFRDAYANEFGFTTGPPLHDALTIIHLTHPHLLKGRRGKLTVDTSKSEKDGETSFSPSSEEKFSSLDLGSGDKGVESLVLEDLDVEAFFEVFLEVVERADEVVAKVEM